MENNINLISDQELRGLINEYLLSDHSNQVLAQELMNMEAQQLFQAAAFLTPNTEKGVNLSRTLYRKLLYKTSFKWLLPILLATGLVTSLYLGYASKPEPIDQKQTISNISQTPKNHKTIENVSLISPFPAKTNSKPFDLKEEDAPSISMAYLSLPKNTLPSLVYLEQKIDLLPGLSLQNPTPIQLNSWIPLIQTNNVLELIQEVVIQSQFANIQVKGDQSLNKESLHFDFDPQTGENEGLELELQTKVAEGILYLTIENKSKKKRYKIKKMPVLNIYLSPEIKMNLTNQSGNVTVQELNTSICKINNRFGNVTIEKVHAHTKIEVNSGNIKLLELEGEVNAQCSFGNINLDRITGQLSTKINSGNLKATGITGDVNIKNEFGNVNLIDLKANLIKAQIKSGNFDLKNASAQRTELNLSFGNITITDLQSNLSIKSNSGKTKLKNITGNTTINDQFSTIHIEQLKGELNATSKSGNLKLQHITGNTQVKSEFSNIDLQHHSGSMEIIMKSGDFTGSDIQLTENSTLSNVFGNVKIQLNNPLSELSIDAKTEMGKLELNKDGQSFKKTKGDLKMGDGKIKVTVQTQSGNIEIK